MGKSENSSRYKGALPEFYQEIKQLKKKWSQSSKEIKQLYEKWSQNPKEEPFYNRREKEAQELMARAEEIKNLLQETHFVFIQGQAAYLAPIQMLINAEAEKQGYRKPHLFKYVRIPEKMSETERFDLVRKIFTKAQNEYDQNEYVRQYLISVDAYFLSTTFEESAYSFLNHNKSILTQVEWNPIEKLATKILSNDQQLSSKQKEKVIQIVNQMSGELENSTWSGNLWVFCIPKTLIQERSEEMLYRSHRRGKLCTCHEGREIEILQALQGNVLNDSNKCHDVVMREYLPMSGQFDPYDRDWGIRLEEEIFSVPQYRLATPHLTPENGVMTFMLTHTDKTQLQSMKKKIRNNIGIS